MTKQRTIKAWAIATKRNVIIDDSGNIGTTLTIFIKKKEAKKYLQDIAMENEWKVVPTEIKIK